MTGLFAFPWVVLAGLGQASRLNISSSETDESFDGSRNIRRASSSSIAVGLFVVGVGGR